ncbi:MAG: L-threonylcarbamoyladenylate synthase [Candidatus Cloacimonadota bacterium]|nr:L-threonylcarbamoyladenylate synthase [Candidatus Cloacimonadota bacterium]
MKKVSITEDKFFRRFNFDQTILHFTGNIYGIGASIYSKQAITKIDSLKDRIENKNYIVLVHNWDFLNEFNIEIDDNIKLLIQQYLPGNLTAILPCSISKIMHITNNSKVAFRIPTSSVLRQFIQKIGTPIISTSINISGEPAVTDYQEIVSKYQHWFDIELATNEENSIDAQPSTIVDFSDSSLHLIRDGSIPFSQIKKSHSKKKILYVCTGNTCRSPLAELYSKSINTSYEFMSAGIDAKNEFISDNSRKILNNLKIDSSKFISKNVDEEAIQSSLIILAMSNKHKNYLLEKYQNYSHKIFSFSEFIDEKETIADPYGEDLSTYQKIFSQIKKYIEKLLQMETQEIIKKLEI